MPIFKNNTLNYYYGQWFFRFGVSLFFISSGFFYNSMNKEKKKQYIRRLIYIYLISTIIYIPLFIKNTTILWFIYNIIFGYGHLWYLSAIISTLLIIYFSEKYIKVNNTKLSIILLLIGILFDEYYKIINLPVINKTGNILSYIGGGRSFIFFAFPLLLIGMIINKNFEQIKKYHIKKIIIYLFLSIIFSFIEITFIRYKLSDNITADMTIFNLIPPVLIFILSFMIDNKKIRINTKLLRKMSDIIYIIHILILNIISNLVSHNGIKFILCYLLSLTIAYITVKLLNILNKSKINVNQI